jgi:hypothetical protein
MSDLQGNDRRRRSLDAAFFLLGRTFIFEDSMGGGFFHSLLGPLLAVPLGFLRGLGARSIHILKCRFFHR